MVKEFEESEKLEKLSINENYKKIELAKISAADIGSKIKTFGWVENCRNKGSMTFIDLVSQFKFVECVYDKKIQLTKCTSITIWATVSKNLSKRKVCDFELHIEKLEIFNDIIAPSFPLNTESSFDSWMKYAHLGLRTKERGFFLKARSTLLKIIRDILYETEHIEITPPTIVQTQVEGGSTLFSLKYYGKDAYLTQSSQLYLETVAPVAHRAFCIMPSYRAENSNTTRHLSDTPTLKVNLPILNLMIYYIILNILFLKLSRDFTMFLVMKLKVLSQILNFIRFLVYHLRESDTQKQLSSLEKKELKKMMRPILK
ncbi:Asparaginyl-tRNA synthetase, cytoplasmic [Nosema bombycis CQ1]|uniref:Asparaginyl-tRNA synthetase, cytoplasmic n=1 Tax=Nosema bombycis (strain CQ1 / CVCC 102059) TaxID=578461 RepID=R0M4Y2_NOSB1|nr:Asparaginyl-tRNA synthetase, cytoplasmic [Nosema bombycis CQ1]|eukprot:EOB13059.1 Asparaginyl-tRNA synthetase, cytoplasmic [Nosema bombycis CQ1]